MKFALYENFSAKLFLYLIFAPNLAISLFPAVPFAGQAWSIGVEEQFYFVWAFLAKKTASFLKMLIGVIVFYLTVKIGLLWAFYVTENSIVKFASNFWGFFTIDAMAIGGLAAYCLFNNKNLNIVFSKLAQIGIYALAAILIVLDFQIPFFTYEIFSIIFALIILNLAGNAHSIVNLENELLSYLGKISYGIYMYHVIAITVAVKLSSYFSNSNLLIYLTAFALTVLISTVSYELFENTFIRAKVKFSVVISGDNGKGGPFCPPLPEVKPQEF